MAPDVPPSAGKEPQAEGGLGLPLESRLAILIKAVEQSPVSILVTDTQGHIEYVNPKFCEVTGYASSEVLGQTPRILKGGFLSREFYQELWTTILGGQEWHGVFHNRTKDGRLVWELASISPIRDGAGTVTHFVGVKEDITELRRLQEQLVEMAHHDPLTGLPNRTLFYDRLTQALAQARRRKASFAIFYLDLDGFKAVNDAWGHEAGDTLLTLAGKRIQECVRESDTVARMGGDEFTVILTDLASKDHARTIADLILEALGQPFILGPEVGTITASIGISFFPEDGASADLLIACADAAMYLVKQTGRNGYRFGGLG